MRDVEDFLLSYNGNTPSFDKGLSAPMPQSPTIKKNFPFDNMERFILIAFPVITLALFLGVALIGALIPLAMDFMAKNPILGLPLRF